MVAGGLSIRPSSHLVLKLEHAQVMPSSAIRNKLPDGSIVDRTLYDIRSYTAQMAVTF